MSLTPGMGYARLFVLSGGRALRGVARPLQLCHPLSMKTMKIFLYAIGAVAALSLAGCGGGSGNPGQQTNAVSDNPLDAPAEYLGALNKAKQTAVKTADLSTIQEALRMYNVDNGHYPKDLNELVEGNYLRRLPAAPYGMKIVYDAASGTAQVVKQ
jgi:hypothetical protein